MCRRMIRVRALIDPLNQPCRVCTNGGCSTRAEAEEEQGVEDGDPACTPFHATAGARSAECYYSCD